MPTLLALALLSGPARAAECPNLDGAAGAVAGVDAGERLAFIEGRMDLAAVHAKRWVWGWGLGFTAVTAGQLALVPLFETPAERRLLVVGAVSSGLGALLLAITPPRVIRDRRVLSRHEGDACAVLGDAEERMVLAADAERFGKSWFMHGGNLLLNAAAGLVLGVLWEQWLDAWTTTAVGSLVGEVMIWTQPMDMTHAVSDYRTGTWAEPSPVRVHLLVGGVGVSGSW